MRMRDRSVAKPSPSRAEADSAAASPAVRLLSPSEVLVAQQTVGNAAVARALMQRQADSAGEAAAGGSTVAAGVAGAG